MTPITTTEGLTETLNLAAQERILANSLTAELDAEIAAAHAKHDHKIKAHSDNEKAYLKLACSYAEKQRGELLPKGKKSIKLGAHELGWEDNGGAIKPRKGMTEKKVLARLTKGGGIMARLFVRHTPALNKTAMAEKWARFGNQLKKLGLNYVSEEIFFVKLDVTQGEDNRVTPEARA